jgi:glycosyltransferase 2 family protein
MATAAPRLRRLPARTVPSVVGGTVAVYLLAGQLSQVNISSALRQARPEWLLIAVLGSAATYLGAALALRAFLPAALPLGRTVLTQLAASFVALVTPPAVGHVGLNIRFCRARRSPRRRPPAAWRSKRSSP